MSFQIIFLNRFFEVDRFSHAWNNTNTILEEAANADELEIEDLFSWNIEDSAKNILDAKDDQVIEDAEALTVTGEENELSIEDYNTLTGEEEGQLDAEFAEDAKYQIVDTAEAIIEAEEVVTDAETVTVQGLVSADDAAALELIREDIKYTTVTGVESKTVSGCLQMS